MATFETAIEKRERALARRATVKGGALIDLGDANRGAFGGLGGYPGSGGGSRNDDNTQPFEFSSSPRALYNNRKFIAGGDTPVPYANLMHEKRVRRGSNFCPAPPMLGEGESAAARAAEARRRNMARTKAKQKLIMGAQLRLGSPPPVKGRRHEPVQTDLYLEEIFINPVIDSKQTQTDIWLDRPLSPYYVPCKTGIDAETQIYPNDLFDFDMEVIPILEVLVGKTIEQSLMEVLEEEELAAIREQQRRFLELRAVDVAEAQRLEERERRLQEEKDRRMREYTEGARLTKQMEERIAACVLVQGYMADLLPRVLEDLQEEGFLVDNVKQDIESHFLPWLIQNTTIELKGMVNCRDVLCEIVKDITENRAENYRAMYEYQEPEGEEEGGAAIDDVALMEHMKLKEEMLKENA